MSTYYIHHFHITYNTPCLPPINFAEELSQFPWDDCNVQEKLETMVVQNFVWGGVRTITQTTLVGWVYYGQCEISKIGADGHRNPT